MTRLPPTPWTISEDGIITAADGRVLLVLAAPEECIEDYHLAVAALVLASPALLAAAPEVILSRSTPAGDFARFRGAIAAARDIAAVRARIAPGHLAPAPETVDA